MQGNAHVFTFSKVNVILQPPFRSARGISVPKLAIVQFLASDSGQSVDDTMVQQASVQSLQLHLNRRDGEFV